MHCLQWKYMLHANRQSHNMPVQQVWQLIDHQSLVWRWMRHVQFYIAAKLLLVPAIVPEPLLFPPLAASRSLGVTLKS